MNVFSSWIFLHRYFLTISVMVTEQLHWRKILCGCFCFMWQWLLIAIMKRYAERCALQLYRTFLKETWNSCFCVTPIDHRLMFVLWKYYIALSQKKSFCVFMLRRRKLLKIAAFVIFPTSIMVLFEIYQTFKSHSLK